MNHYETLCSKAPVRGANWHPRRMLEAYDFRGCFGITRVGWVQDERSITYEGIAGVYAGYFHIRASVIDPRNGERLPLVFCSELLAVHSAEHLHRLLMQAVLLDFAAHELAEHTTYMGCLVWDPHEGDPRR